MLFTVDTTSPIVEAVTHDDFPTTIPLVTQTHPATNLFMSRNRAEELMPDAVWHQPVSSTQYRTYNRLLPTGPELRLDQLEHTLTTQIVEDLETTFIVTRLANNETITHKVHIVTGLYHVDVRLDNWEALLADLNQDSDDSPFMNGAVKECILRIFMPFYATLDEQTWDMQVFGHPNSLPENPSEICWGGNTPPTRELGLEDSLTRIYDVFSNRTCLASPQSHIMGGLPTRTPELIQLHGTDHNNSTYLLQADLTKLSDAEVQNFRDNWSTYFTFCFNLDDGLENKTREWGSNNSYVLQPSDEDDEESGDYNYDWLDSVTSAFFSELSRLKAKIPEEDPAYAPLHDQINREQTRRNSF